MVTYNILGNSYSYFENEMKGANQDRFRYVLPNGETYTHPTENGCKIMIAKDVVAHNGYKLEFLPDTADFKYAVSKDGYEEKWYTIGGVIVYFLLLSQLKIMIDLS